MIRVSAAFVTHNHKVLLFHRDNIPTIADPDKWSLIGGHVENNESFDKGLIRELEEEISVKIKDFQFLFEFIGSNQELVYIYHVRLSKDQVKQIKLGSEGQEVSFFSFEQLEDLPLTTNLQEIYKKYHSNIQKILD